MFYNAVVLAAGKGERMKPLTDYVPKPLIKYKDVSLIDWALRSLPIHSNKYITYGYLGSQVLVKLHGAVEGFIPNYGGNASWLKNSLFSDFNQPIVIIPCDISFNIHWEKLYEEYIESGSVGMIVPTERLEGYEGDFISHNNGSITSINREFSHFSDTEIIASGIQIINPVRLAMYDAIKDNFYDIWNKLIYCDELAISETRPENWIGIDRLDQL